MPVEGVVLADNLIKRGISDEGIEHTVEGIRSFGAQRGYCTQKQLLALENIKTAMDNHDERKKQFNLDNPASLRVGDGHWGDDDDGYFYEDAYGHNT